MVKKRYIWFSVPALILLLNLTMLQCLFPRKGCLLLMVKFQLAFSVLVVGVTGIPVAINEMATRINSPFGTILAWLTLYFVGVLATYLLTLWREKNMPHLRKSKGKEK